MGRSPRLRYLTKVKGSQNWYCQLVLPMDLRRKFPGSNPKRLISLRTPDTDEAAAQAAKHIAGFKHSIWMMRAVVNGDYSKAEGVEYTQEPGTTVSQEDGTLCVATETQIIRLGPDLQPIGPPVPNIAQPIVKVSFRSTKEFREAERIHPIRPKEKENPNKIDLDILAFWVRTKQVKEGPERIARRTYKVFRQVAPNKNFATATRSDGRRLAERLYADGLSSASVEQNVGFLRAACNQALKFADDFPALRMNPFSNVVERRDDEQKRMAFDDRDMGTLYKAMWDWEPDERLLWALCATTGMRRSEAWDIDSEELISGYRVLHYGHKTQSSDRRVPVPSDLVPFLPDKIEGPLFPSSVTPKALGKRLLRRIREAGITDPRKVLHSARHRASTRMHGVKNDSVRDAVLGHDDNGRGGKKRASVRYFGGHPIETIVEAVEMIGIGKP